MDLEKLYENIVLRDLLQYLTPGSILLLGLCVFLETVLKRLDAKISLFRVLNGSTISLILAFILAYLAGQMVAGACGLFLREDMKKPTTDVLNNNPGLMRNVGYLIKFYFQDIGFDDMENLSTPEGAASLREIVRTLIQYRMPSLNKEFVARHSILARFCQNMALALATLLIFILLSAWVSWSELSAKLQTAPALAISTAIFILLLIVLGIVICWHRSARLRDIMIKNTFQIWLADYIVSNLEKKQEGGTATSVGEKAESSIKSRLIFIMLTNDVS
jgi:hypothetical protein